ncbi:MAG: SAM-dependent chlorinase/fluorinase [bacterium]
MMSDSGYRRKRTRPIIVLLSDFGAGSFYVGAMKAAVLSVDPNATLVDLTHDIRPYRVDEAGFVLARVFDLFAPGSVFVAVVDPGVGGKRRNLVFKSAGRYIVAPDNGLVSEVAVSFGIESVVAVDDETAGRLREHPSVGRTFLGRDVFGPVAGYLSGGGSMDGLGPKVDDYAVLEIPPVEVDEGRVKGVGRYVDSFGNVVSNIARHHLERAFVGVALEKIRGTVNNTIEIDGIFEFFSQREIGRLMLVLDSWGLVEISVNQGRAIDRFLGDPAVGIELSVIRSR